MLIPANTWSFPPMRIQTFLAQTNRTESIRQILSDKKVRDAFLGWAEVHKSYIYPSAALKQINAQARTFARLPPDNYYCAAVANDPYLKPIFTALQLFTFKNPDKMAIEPLFIQWSCAEIGPDNSEFQALLRRIARQDDLFHYILSCIQGMAPSRRLPLWEYQLDSETTFIQALAQAEPNNITIIFAIFTEYGNVPADKDDFAALMPILNEMDPHEIWRYWFTPTQHVFSIPQFISAIPLFNKFSNERNLQILNNRNYLHTPSAFIAAVPLLLRLEPDDIEKVLSVRDSSGRTPLHSTIQGYTHLFQESLPLFGKVSVEAMKRLLALKWNGRTPIDWQKTPSLDSLRRLDDDHLQALLSTKHQGEKLLSRLARGTEEEREFLLEKGFVFESL